MIKKFIAGAVVLIISGCGDLSSCVAVDDYSFLSGNSDFSISAGDRENITFSFHTDGQPLKLHRDMTENLSIDILDAGIRDPQNPSLFSRSSDIFRAMPVSENPIQIDIPLSLERNEETYILDFGALGDIETGEFDEIGFRLRMYVADPCIQDSGSATLYSDVVRIRIR